MSPLFATLGEANARALLHRGVEGVEEVRCGGTGDRESRGAIFIASKCLRFLSSIISSCLRLLLPAWFSFSNNFMHFVKNSKTLFEPTWNRRRYLVKSVYSKCHHIQKRWKLMCFSLNHVLCFNKHLLKLWENIYEQ